MEHFRGTERFAIQRRLGSGSFGVVYEVFDQERQCRVALKVPHGNNPQNLYLFKQEFRALADVAHPNLVNLYELIAQGQDWFFTMELVEGRNFYEHLRPGDSSERRAGPDPAGDPGAVRAQSLASVYGQGSGSYLESPQAPAAEGPFRHQPPEDYGQVRMLLRQLAEGLWALHQIGQLHGDLKPTNVLVAPGGRVVLLDFGLAVEMAGAKPDLKPDPGRLAGTPAFMAPEQIGGHVATEASDWYAVGVMLYQVLTGQLPFPGHNLSSVINKMRMDPASPASLLAETPADLDALCMELLRRKPELRPAGLEILERLGGSTAGAPMRNAGLPQVATSNLLIGRERELATLTQAYETSQQGKAVLGLVHGASGLGKSYLLRRFLRDLQRDEPRTVLLQGRCYEQESVPYKAMDSLMDGLSQYLKTLPPPKLAALLPRNIHSLARLFPVLNQVPAIADVKEPPPTTPDRQELRRRAFGALRGLLSRLGDRYPLVLVIDNLQWGDQDSLALLVSLFRTPNPPSLLVLATFRGEDGPGLQELRALQERFVEEGAEVVQIGLEELPPDEAVRLAMALLGGELAHVGAEARRIARTAHGSPFFIAELARHLQEGVAANEFEHLEGFIRARVAKLPAASRQLLETLALAGHPLEWEVLRQACGCPEADPEALTLLRAGHLIRVRTTQRMLLEPHHDRIRQAVLGEIPEPRRQELHLNLAQALERSRPLDAQALAHHYQAAGEIGKAAEYARMAADQAVAALAFDRAAQLFKLVLELKAPKGQVQRELLVKLGDAQAQGGAGADAARSYLLAIQGSSAYEAIRLQRRASEEFLRSGHFDQGVATLQTVIATFGLTLQGSPLRALVSAAWSRFRLRLRGYGFQERRESQILQADLDRIDACWAAAMGLGPIDHFRGGEFQARQLLLTLEAGEPFRLVRALAHETIHLSHRGNRNLKATHRVQALTLALAERIGHPNPLSRAFIAAGTAALMQGRWKASVDLLRRAENLLRENCTGLDYELHIAQHHALLGQLIMGNLKEVELRLSSRLQTAREKGDLLAVTNLRTSIAPFLHLAQDDAPRALREVQQAMQEWSSAGFHVQHYNALCAAVNGHLYLGESARAWELLRGQWRALRRSLLLRVQVIRITCRELRARAGLARAMAEGPTSQAGMALMKLAHGDIHALEAERTPYGEALALKLQAMEAMVLGRPEEAGALYFQAEIAFQACDMGLHAAVVRRCRGLLEGPPGADHLEAAEKWMHAQGIVNPVRFALMHVPTLEPRLN